jgi:hypothetical protein
VYNQTLSCSLTNSTVIPRRAINTLPALIDFTSFYYLSAFFSPLYSQSFNPQRKAVCAHRGHSQVNPCASATFLMMSVHAVKSELDMPS